MIYQNFEKALKKGQIGQDIVKKYLLSKGIIPYEPPAMSHPFDFLCATRDGKTLYIAEVKTKSRRTYYADTGINRSQVIEYLNIQERHKIEVMIFFVDETLGQVYGNLLNILIQERVVDGVKYPFSEVTRSGVKIVYFPLSIMKTYADIPKEKITEIKNENQRNYSYPEGLTSGIGRR